jgi:hypothetical protein
MASTSTSTVGSPRLPRILRRVNGLNRASPRTEAFRHRIRRRPPRLSAPTEISVDERHHAALTRTRVPSPSGRETHHPELRCAWGCQRRSSDRAPVLTDTLKPECDLAMQDGRRRPPRDLHGRKQQPACKGVTRSQIAPVAADCAGRRQMRAAAVAADHAPMPDREHLPGQGFASRCLRGRTSLASP